MTAGRPYSDRVNDVIQNLAARIRGNDDETHPLLKRRPIKNVAVIMVTSDKGLAGALNTNIIRRTTRFILQEANNSDVSLIAVGRKGRDFMVRYGRKLIAEFINYERSP